MTDRYYNSTKELKSLFKQAWDDGSECALCPHYHEWQEYHPFGSTTAAETLAECLASWDPDPKCPWIEKHRQKESSHDR